MDEVNTPASIKTVDAEIQPCGRSVIITITDIYKVETHWVGPLNPSDAILQQLCIQHIAISAGMTRRN